MSRYTAYRLLSGEDGTAFSHEVTKALAEGWLLFGGPACAWDAEARVLRCAQAVTKEVDGTYDPGVRLGEL